VLFLLCREPVFFSYFKFLDELKFALPDTFWLTRRNITLRHRRSALRLYCLAKSSAKEGASFCCYRDRVSFRRKLTGTKYQGEDFVPKAPWRRRLYMLFHGDFMAKKKPGQA
jgi:hypothetical protein